MEFSVIGHSASCPRRESRDGRGGERRRDQTVECRPGLQEIGGEKKQHIIKTGQNPNIGPKGDGIWVNVGRDGDGGIPEFPSLGETKKHVACSFSKCKSYGARVASVNERVLYYNAFTSG